MGEKIKQKWKNPFSNNSNLERATFSELHSRNRSHVSMRRSTTYTVCSGCNCQLVWQKMQEVRKIWLSSAYFGTGTYLESVCNRYKVNSAAPTPRPPTHLPTYMLYSTHLASWASIPAILTAEFRSFLCLFVACLNCKVASFQLDELNVIRQSFFFLPYLLSP